MIENRIVRMIFDNATFKKAAAETKGSLDGVNQAISNAGKNAGLLDLGKGMDAIAVKAGKMQVAVLTAVGTVANKATNAALGALNSLTFAPMKQGFLEYEALLTKQNVIMNSTGESAGKVKKILTELNKYSDDTIYSFSDMTSAVTKFTNAGITLPKSVTAIKGIANAAAFAGASSEEAGRAMYAFSQSMGLGFVGLQDWMQIENANMGTVKFKQKIIDAGVALGTLTKKGKMYITSTGKAVSATKGWRDGLQEKWATTQVLTKALSAYSDQTTKFGRRAQQAATEVRTFSAFMGTLRESIGSGWASVFTELFGGLEESTKMWTGLSGAIGGVVKSFFDFIATSLRVWREMGGAQKVMTGFKNILSPFIAIFKAIGDAWRKVFPKSSTGAGSALYGLSYGFELLTKPLLWLSKLILLLTHPLALFFQLIKFGVGIIKGAAGYVADFVKKIWNMISFKAPSAGDLWSYIKSVAKAIRDAIVDVVNLIKKGESLQDAFANFEFKWPKPPEFKVQKLGGAGGWFKGLFGGNKEQSAETKELQTAGLSRLKLLQQGKLTPEKITDEDGISNIRQLEGGLGRLKSTVTTSIANVRQLEGGFLGLGTATGGSIANVRQLERGVDSLNPTLDTGTANARQLEGETSRLEGTLTTVQEKGRSFMDVLKGIGTWLKTVITGITGEDITTSLNFAVLATLGLVFAKVLYSIYKMFKNFSNIGAGIGDALGGIGDAFSSFQTAARAKLILNIGIAIGILALSLWLLSTIPEDKMQTALQGLAGVIAALGIVLIIFTKTLTKLGPGAVLQMYALGFAITAIGLGLLLMATAMLIMKKVGFKDLLKGLITLIVVFAALNVLGKLANTGAKNMLAAGLAMIAMGIALVILAGAMLLFKLVNPSDMVKAGLALLAFTAALVILSVVPPGVLLGVAVAMVSMSYSLLILAAALLIFALVKWSAIAKASVVLLVLAAALIVITLFGGGPVGATGLIALAVGVLILAAAMMIFNKVSWNAVAKGAVALVILIAALALLFVVLFFAAPLVPLLVALGYGFAAMAIGLALLITALAVGLPLIAAGAAAFAVIGTAAVAAIAAFLQALAHEAPVMKKAALKIFQVFCDGIVESIPIILDTIRRVLRAIWDFFAGPPAAEPGKAGGDSIMRSLQKKLQEWTPKILEEAEKLMKAFMKRLEENADNIAATAVSLIVSLINGIASQADEVADAGMNLLISMIEGIDNAIRSRSGELGEAISSAIGALVILGEDLVEGLGEGIGAAGRSLATSPVRLFSAIVRGVVQGGNDEADTGSPSKKMIKLGKFMVMGLTVGIQSGAAAAILAVTSLVKGQIATARSYISGYVQKLDQQVIASRAKAEGLAKDAELANRAADRASELAQKTEKNKKDDKVAEAQKEAAEKLSEAAEKQNAASEKMQEKADKAREAADRKAEYEKASTLEKAKMRSEDAQRQIDDAKAAEERAAKDLANARALEKAAKSGKFSKSESKELAEEAEELRKSAKKNVELSNDLIKAAKKSASDALALQKKAGAEAAAEFEKQYKAEAEADAKVDAFEKLTDAQKAVSRRKSAANLAEWSKKNLANAKKLAYTDLEAANEMAQKANEQADQAREYLKEAEGYEKAVAEEKAAVAKEIADKAEEDRKQAEEDAKYVRPVNIPITGTTSVDVTASDAAALAFQNYADLYSTSSAAAAAGQSVQFNQYNTSPEALSPTEVYRQTNNLLTHASDKLGKAA